MASALLLAESVSRSAFSLGRAWVSVLRDRVRMRRGSFILLVGLGWFCGGIELS